MQSLEIHFLRSQFVKYLDSRNLIPAKSTSFKVINILLVGIYLLKLTIETLEQGAKYVQNYQ